MGICHQRLYPNRKQRMFVFLHLTHIDEEIQTCVVCDTDRRDE